MSNCKNCIHWKQDAKVIEEKFHHSNAPLGWCGNMATGANDWCPSHEPVKQEQAAWG